MGSGASQGYALELCVDNPTLHEENPNKPPKGLIDKAPEQSGAKEPLNRVKQHCLAIAP
jgi:hypothetical protein